MISTIIGGEITSKTAIAIISSFVSDFLEVVRGKAYEYVENKINNDKIDNKIVELVEFFSKFESDQSTLFLTGVQAAFSKDNIKKILEELRTESEWDLEAALREKLLQLCREYGIVDDNGDHMIDHIVEMYFGLTVEYNPSMAQKLFYNRLNKQGNIINNTLEVMNSRIEIMGSQIQQIWSNNISYEMHHASDETCENYVKGTVVGSDEDLFVWELNLKQAKVIYENQEERKNAVLELINQWRDERLKYPGWFIAPVGKRETLSIYTRDEELLWNTKDLSLQDRLDFSYELVWRYETGMEIYREIFQKNIYRVWKEYYDTNEFSNVNNNINWFYIGQALLRDYREDMNWGKWDEIFYILYDKHTILAHGEDELNLEFMKQLFFRMQITDVRDKVQQYVCPEKLYAIRLQKYGLMAECGLLQEAYQEIKQLVKDLKKIFSIIEEENKKEKVYIGSILACAYNLLSLVIQGLHPFKRPEELIELWNDQKEFDKFYNYEHETHQWNNNLYNYYCKHREVPFELNRFIRTQCWGSDGSDRVYSFYRVLDRMGIPLSVGMTRLLPHQEIEFIGVILKIAPYLGCYMLLRTGNEKAIKTLITRKFCIEIGFEWCRKLFDYVWDSLEQNIESIRVNKKRGNAYAHLLKNGLEILCRLVSAASAIQQRKIMMLMCKLIDADIMQELRVMDRWITQVLGVVDEKIKAQFLNEILMTSTKNRSHLKGEKSLDPFEVISTNISARKYYEKEHIDPVLIDNLIHCANESDEDRIMIIPRLGKLYTWHQLSPKQEEKFRDLIWKKTNEQTGLPDLRQYYGAVFIDWPVPGEIDIRDLVRQYIMNPDWYIKLKENDLSSITMGCIRIYDEIQCLNSLYPEFLSLSDKETLLEYLAECWEYGRNQFEKNVSTEFYNKEFTDRYQTMERVIGSFSIVQLNQPLKQRLETILIEMKSYGINVFSARAAVCIDVNEMTLLVEEIIDAFYSDDKNVIIDATNASEIIIKKWPDSEGAMRLLSEQIRLIRYGRQPGLKYFFITVHNLLYLKKLSLSKETMIMLNKALVECCQYTSYDKMLDKSETYIHDMIRLRQACAHTASVLYKYINKDTDETCKVGIEKWKEICTGYESQHEFEEVKRCWLE